MDHEYREFTRNKLQLSPVNPGRQEQNPQTWKPTKLVSPPALLPTNLFKRILSNFNDPVATKLPHNNTQCNPSSWWWALGMVQSERSTDWTCENVSESLKQTSLAITYTTNQFPVEYVPTGLLLESQLTRFWSSKSLRQLFCKRKNWRTGCKFRYLGYCGLSSSFVSTEHLTIVKEEKITTDFDL
jgi:hypothetical protein